MEHNVYAAWRAAMPTGIDGVAVEVADAPQPLAYTWADLDRGSAMIANVFALLALPVGSRVVAQVEKSVEALMLYLAVLRAGHVYVPLNTAYPETEVTYFLQDAEPAVVVCMPERFGWLSKAAFRLGVGHVFTLGTERDGTLLHRAMRQADAHPIVPRAAQDAAALVYTSGTTGRSKGAILTHGNLLANAQVLHRHWGWQAEDVLLHALPMFHVHGLFVATHAALLGGSRMLWFNRFEPRAVAERLPDATVFMGVPTLYTRLLADPALTRAACAGMRLFISGSAPLLSSTFDAFTERTGHVILERYGMSETLMLTSNPYRWEGHTDGRGRRGGTVGPALPGVGLRIVDAQGAVLPDGAVGEVEVTSPSVCAGYWRRPDATQEAFTADGWFRTGDVGVREPDGWLRLVGRSKDLIISGGYNVYPAEVEEVLNAWPGVQESAVIGVPHADFGEGVVALLVPQPGAVIDTEALRQHLRTRLANYKQPKRWIVCESLPRNAMGKVLKNVLRQTHQAVLA